MSFGELTFYHRKVSNVRFVRFWLDRPFQRLRAYCVDHFRPEVLLPVLFIVGVLQPTIYSVELRCKCPYRLVLFLPHSAVLNRTVSINTLGIVNETQAEVLEVLLGSRFLHCLRIGLPIIIPLVVKLLDCSLDFV